MWDRHFEPPFVLPPKHAAVFRDAAACLSDDIGWEEWEEGWETGIAVLDPLSQGQKQGLILTVTRALLDPSSEPPDVTAALAATVDAIYRRMETFLELEISFGEETTVREAILDAMDEMGYWAMINSDLEPDEEPTERLQPMSTDSSAWADLVEDLREEILEDYDFEMDAEFLDMPPGNAAQLKREMNIAPDYFVAVPSDPTPKRLAEIRAELRRWVL